VYAGPKPRAIRTAPSDLGATLGHMFQVELVCSDPRCDAELTLWVDELGEVEAVACECGHGLVTVRIEGFEPVLLAV
jgi:hypothetical protein